MHADIVVEEIAIPRSLTDPDVDPQPYRDVVDVLNRAEADVTGLPELDWLPEEQHPHTQDPEAPPRMFLVRDTADTGDGNDTGDTAGTGTPIACGVYNTKSAEGTPNCWITVAVLPEHRRRGIGTALADHIEAIARAHGRTQWKSYVVSGTAGAVPGPGFLAAPTGFGAVPEDEAGTRFSAGRGWRFGQVNRISRMTLPPDVEAVARIRAEAEAKAGDEYRVHTWTGRTPEQWLAGIALLETRMSTDAPEGDMEEPEDVWSVERLREHEANLEAAPRTMLTIAVEHVPTGELVGFSQLAVPDRVDAAVMQWDTLVLREHRGHRLGWLLKTVGIEVVADRFPGHPSIVTFNAEENRPMLDVNEAVGFVGVGSESVWEHRIVDTAAPAR